jgi:hypothetical protein
MHAMCVCAQVAGIRSITVGGEHERWEVPCRPPGSDDDGDGDPFLMPGKAPRQHGEAPKVRARACVAGCAGTRVRVVGCACAAT